MKQVVFFLGLFFLFLACIASTGCNTPQGRPAGTTLVLNVSSAHNKKAFIEKLPYGKEKVMILDSALVINMSDSIVFHIPQEPDRLYRIRISDSRFAFNFIADAPHIHVKANNINGKYAVEGSPASASLKEYMEKQVVFNDSINKVAMQLDSARKNGLAAQVKRLTNREDSLLKLVQAYNTNYADTVSNAAAFIRAFANIDFGTHMTELRTIVDKAGKRFPASKAVQMVRQDALDMISIYEEEYNVGDSLPSISLPDVNGQSYNTASLRGRFYLLDFWASWYPKTLAVNGIKKQVAEAYPPQKLQLVSVALDDNKTDWANIIHSQNLNWVQLIDEDMWHGTAAKTLKFDSIPFNFLVNDKGRIIAKAIKPDSLMQVLRNTVK
jgi:hypothetical protein